MTRQSIVKGDALQKIGSAGFIIGAILMAIGGLLIPYAATPTSNVQEMLRPLGEQLFRTELSVLLLIVSIWATMIGVVGVYCSITASGGASSGAVWARLGFYFMLVGTAIYTVTLTQDASTADAVANWLAAPTAHKEAAYGAVAALNAVGRGLYPVALIVYWVPFAFLGIAMLLSAVYPHSLGWAGPGQCCDRPRLRPEFHRTYDHAYSHLRGSFTANGTVGLSGRHLGRPKSVVTRHLLKNPDLKGVNHAKVDYQPK
jgi:hypothetical protein